MCSSEWIPNTYLSVWGARGGMRRNKLQKSTYSKISFLYIKRENIYLCWYRYKNYLEILKIEGMKFGKGRYFILSIFEMLGFYLILQQKLKKHPHLPPRTRTLQETKVDWIKINITVLAF